jgi:hypothetical protein
MPKNPWRHYSPEACSQIIGAMCLAQTQADHYEAKGTDPDAVQTLRVIGDMLQAVLDKQPPFPGR